MVIKFLKDFDLKGKRVLLRADLNSDVKGGKVVLGERIKEAVRSILALKKKGATVVVLAHQGNPGKADFLSLRQHAKLLNKYIKVKFVADVCGIKAVTAINDLKSREVLLLENVRFVEDEFKPKKWGNILIKNLVPMFDLYVNDAFSVSHREHTSLVRFPKELPSCAGILMEEELKALQKIKVKNCLYVLGGAKPESNAKLLGKGAKVLACGFFGQMCLISQGVDLGYQNDYLRINTLVKGNYNSFLKKLRKNLDGVFMPRDFAVLEKGNRVEYMLEEFPLNIRIDDVGERTLKKYISEVKKARGIYVKGPAGYVGDKRFEKGTVELLRAIAGAKGFSVVGGGHLSDVIAKYKIKGFDHVSLSGGALARWMAGEKLAGIEALK
jgi:phosphoglycerate kinase